MEQLTLFSLCYKYIIDSSSIDSQKDNEPHTRIVYQTLWRNIEHLIHEKVIVTSSEIVPELQDPEIINWRFK